MVFSGAPIGFEIRARKKLLTLRLGPHFIVICLWNGHRVVAREKTSEKLLNFIPSAELTARIYCLISIFDLEVQMGRRISSISRRLRVVGGRIQVAFVGVGDDVAEARFVGEGFAAALGARNDGIDRRKIPREDRPAFVEMLLRVRERREMSGNY